MIVILKQNAKEDKIKQLLHDMKLQGIKASIVKGEQKQIITLIGDTTKINSDNLLANDIVENIKRISEPYKEANRKFHPKDTIISMSNQKIGEGNFTVIAGPCSVESEKQIIQIAQSVKQSGAAMLRGGAYKPRTSPYAFQGLRQEGISLLLKAKKVTGLPIVTEIMSIRDLDQFEDVDMIQVGARNMQNFELLKELGHCKKPIFLKRGLANTIQEWLMSAEYIMSGGNPNVILCERGIRTFETMTRNTLDISAVTIIKQISHLPVFVDPSHAAGIPSLIEPLSKASIAAGADGIMIEVHNNPANALSDGAQALTPQQFDKVMVSIKKLNAFVNKDIQTVQP